MLRAVALGRNYSRLPIMHGSLAASRHVSDLIGTLTLA